MCMFYILCFKQELARSLSLPHPHHQNYSLRGIPQSSYILCHLRAASSNFHHVRSLSLSVGKLHKSEIELASACVCGAQERAASNSAGADFLWRRTSLMSTDNSICNLCCCSTIALIPHTLYTTKEICSNVSHEYVFGQLEPQATCLRYYITINLKSLFLPYLQQCNLLCKLMFYFFKTRLKWIKSIGQE